MYDRPVLDVEDALALVDAALAAAPTQTNRPIAVAVVDDMGDWVAFVRMDGAAPFTREFARKKAYTSSIMRRDLQDFAALRAETGRVLVEMGDPRLVGATSGGVVIKDSDGNVLGGLGVSGGAPEEDDRIARAAISASPIGGLA